MGLFHSRLIGNGVTPVHIYWELLNGYRVTGKIDPTSMITRRFPFENMAKIYAAFDKRTDGVERVYVETKFSREGGVKGSGLLGPRSVGVIMLIALQMPNEAYYILLALGSRHASGCTSILLDT
ncbi:hypothetical protein PM082_012265 [Marasmius tenuissimus]|nr:hypothetical protein PM082_012265 [Marasmius tenuissimus]